MKNITKTIILLIVITMLFQNTLALASVIDIGQTIYLERSNEGYYCLERINEKNNQWEPVEYSTKVYRDKYNFIRTAYGTSYDTNGIGWKNGESEGYNVVVQNKKVDDRVWRIIKKGYPNANPTSLGLENENDEFLATQEAILVVLSGKQWTDVDRMYRERNVPIGNDSPVEVSRRGKNVIEAIRKLVEEAQNGNEIMETAQIEKIGKFELDDKDSNYYSQKYNVISAVKDSMIEIKEIFNAPKGAFVCDENGTRRIIFCGGDIIKVMVPKENIDDTYNPTVKYTSNCQNFPVYYGKSTKENTQDYYLVSEMRDIYDYEDSFSIPGFKSELNIIKVDAETGNPIPGVKFEVQSDDAKVKGQYVTDKNGRIRIKELKQGAVTIQEVETSANYILDKTKREVNINYDQLYTIEIGNEHKKGKFEIQTIDDKGEPIVGNEFRLKDETGKELATSTTGEAGIAIFSNINTGKYMLTQIKCADGHKMLADQIINITDGEALKIVSKNGEAYNTKLEENKNVTEINDGDDMSNPKITIKADSIETATSNQEVMCEYTIKNNGNTEIKDLNLFSFIPIEYAQLTKMTTGTYNQKINYSIYYKTNKKADYLVLEKDLDSLKNNTIDIKKVYLEEGEKITEIRFAFGDVKPSFATEQKPYIYIRLNSGIKDDTKIENPVILEGHYENYKLSADDIIKINVENFDIGNKKLPRTGF